MGEHIPPALAEKYKIGRIIGEGKTNLGFAKLLHSEKKCLS
jgi:hypothetical protein